jgi:WD40 repeat protein
VTMPEPLVHIAVDGCRCVRVSPDGTAVLTVGRGGVQVWESAMGRPVWSRPLEALAALPVEALWAAGGESALVLTGGTLRLYGAATGEELALPVEVQGLRNVTALALSADGLHLAVGAQEGQVLLLDQGTRAATRLRGGDSVTALAWHPAGVELCVTRPRSIQFWHLDAQTMISSLSVRDVHPTRLAWSPDGELIVAAGLHDVRAFSVRTRTEAATPLDLGGRPVGLGFSRTGTTVLVGRPDGSVALLDRWLKAAPATLPAEATEAATLHVNETGVAAVRADGTADEPAGT